MNVKDIDQIVEGIEHFIIGPQYSKDLYDIWQPYIDKLKALRLADAPVYDEAKAVAAIEKYHRIAGILRNFYVQPLSISTLQPILDLAVEMNPELAPKVKP